MRTPLHIFPRYLLVFAFALAFGLGACTGGTKPGSSGKSASANTFDYYPAKAIRLGLTGRVGLEYSVNDKGRAENIVVTESGGQILDDGAKQLVSTGHYAPAATPVARYRIGVIFNLTNKPKVAEFNDGRQNLTVTASGLPGT